MSLLNEFENRNEKKKLISQQPDTKTDAELLDYYINKEGGKEQLFSEIDYILNGDPELIDESNPYDENGGPIEFRKIHDAMVAVNWRCFIKKDKFDVPTAEELKDMLKEQLFRLFEIKCDAIDGIWHTGYEIDRQPDEDTPDDFQHRVNICVRFNFETYDSLW